MKIAIASDRGGFKLKVGILDNLNRKGYDITDFGCTDANLIYNRYGYPDYAEKTCSLIREGKFDRGILICGTGIGMSIAANKIKGIRCALVHDTFSASQTRIYNDSNVIALGEMIIGETLAIEIIDIWLATSFSGNINRIKKIEKLENI